ncbi:hypothetical protein DTO013E5_7087 [Penicillium roqueforti]|uniref:Nucleotide-binding, alpha-beta plait n=1 Tax=Penicillium roqueforti (strain FM164) TaxID=1365484 RepID=W6PS60_PENRF|nr:uncharacterized protein LCP9604111_3131 [Penicillium roqueforti]CDM26705.1 Nucleotide-binding, alpha-beta plait [Penicillium roqueforti FM164]KAF9250927.1 hypothetical protein LCP9604111_3131 [Penicillium roqueforti]KAI1833476.1 hypothetical protein CBS147337_5515 [Penicillium roqueforti]KAI2673108.1 hypothetical protein CBS147355_7911 [Penicillium roqueforti]KAI2674729.1 hypothetical protein LCP963914a_8651 [Penicillium roqueforti]
MSSRSARGQSPLRSPEQDQARSRSLHRSKPRSESPSRSLTRSPSQGRHDRYRSRTRSRSPSRGRTRSRSPSRAGRRHNSRSESRSITPNASPPRSSKIVVEKLTKNVTENHIREIFGGFGEIEYLDLPINKAFMTNRGTAYIIYYDPADAEAAIAHMHEAQLDGAILNVSIVLPRRKFSRSPPPASNRVNGGRPRYGRVPYAGPSSPRRHGGGRPTDRHDIYRPKTASRSRSPVRSRSYSSRSRSPALRRGSPRTESRHHRRRSPSYSSYGYSSRSRSPNRNRGHNRK